MRRGFPVVEFLKDGDLLYHGSFCEVQTPDLRKCARYKDFGQGFYLTTDKKQAETFAKISTQKAVENGVVASQRYGECVWRDWLSLCR